ncbi:MAG: signal peptidase I [Spirochaetales bacterium]|nr:signal peptidase I [Spirochaetales bacterium]
MKNRGISPGIVILTALLVFIVIKLFILDIMIVRGQSMKPTLNPGDLIVIDKCAYGIVIPLKNRYLFRWGRPRRGDIVLLLSPENTTVIVKRCVAIEGDFFDIRNGYLEVDGNRYLYAHPDGITKTFTESVVPGDSIMVLGDNPMQSVDSRMFGFVPVSDIIGRVIGL